MPRFSERQGFRPAVPITVREEAPRDFRIFVVDLVQRFLSGEYADYEKCRFVYVTLGQIPGYSWTVAKNRILATDWYRVYDLLESLNVEVNRVDPEGGRALRRLLNNYFEDNGFGYKVTADGHIEHRGDESFEAATHKSREILSAAGLSTSADEIHKALSDLSKRPAPDLTGAVQHAMAGLECAVKAVAQEPGLELGKILKRRKDLFPPPLDQVLSQLYGFASNYGRHLVEGGEPDMFHAELVVSVAAAAATYLARTSVSQVVP